jgi:hypothetical protein
MNAKPIRIQRKRVKGYRMPPNTVSVCRPGIFGNPFPSDISGPEDAVDRFKRWAVGNMSALEMSQSSRADRWSGGNQSISLVTVRSWLRDELPKLRGKNLACFCALDAPCHADVLLELANAPVSAP